MNQQQTNTLFLFLLIAIFQFAGYSILTGSLSGGNNSFAIIVMLLISGLFTGIYYLISTPTRIPIIWNDIRHRFTASIIQALIFVIFVGVFLAISLIAIVSWAGIDKYKEIGIGMLTGIVSGAIIIFIQRAFFYDRN
jgi:hypothetical protein